MLIRFRVLALRNDVILAPLYRCSTLHTNKQVVNFEKKKLNNKKIYIVLLE